MSRVKFINQDTGFVCGGFNAVCSYLAKTTNGGVNWLGLNTPCNLHNNDMSVLNESTIRVVDRNSFDGGVYLTTNGGVNWQNQLSLGSSNPERIYMFNNRIGFICKDGGSRYIRKTTDSGMSWFVLDNNDYFNDIYFADSMTGWKCSVFGMKKTTDGGFNWITQVLPFGGLIQVSTMIEFSNVNQDTIWGVGGAVLYPNNQYRGIIYRTTNSGTNWLFQIPDTSIAIAQYNYCDFINKLTGWAYRNSPTGVHTTTGGDPIWYTGIMQISSEVPKLFQLGQNYPNPFNNSSKFRVRSSKLVYTEVKVFDITARLITVLLNQKLNAGEYEITFDAKELPSGVYFYSLFVDGNLIDTKKMILLK